MDIDSHGADNARASRSRQMHFVFGCLVFVQRPDQAHIKLTSLKASDRSAISRVLISSVQAHLPQFEEHRRNYARKLLKSSTAALMLICMTGDAWAAANSRVVQTQKTCSRYELRGSAKTDGGRVFVSSSRSLQQLRHQLSEGPAGSSDRALQNFFLRLNAKTGIADYHSFKTRLANTSSIQSFRDTNYCVDAQTTFEAALSKNRSLSVFMAGQTTAVDDSFSPCQVLTASTNKTPRP
jgi:hypothetical protein